MTDMVNVWLLSCLYNTVAH